MRKAVEHRRLSRLEISDLSLDVIELILSFLPTLNLIRASIVCKQWHSIISSASFSKQVQHINQHQPWLFLHCCEDIFTLDNKTQTFAFDPSSNSWFLLPTIPTPYNNRPTFALFGNDGFMFNSNPYEFLYTSIFHPVWHATPPPLHCEIFDVFINESKFIVGGQRSVEGDTIFDLEIYDPVSKSWELGPPSPITLKFTYFKTLIKGNKFYLLNKSNGFVFSFDLQQKVWSVVLTSKPPEDTEFNFLIAGREQLIIVGCCILTHGINSIKLWKVDEKTMKFAQISVMPDNLYCCLFGNNDEYPIFECVGMGDLVYVLNEENYDEICVCEISGESGECVWRRVPRIPGEQMNEFFRVSSFCSTISLHSILGDREHRGSKRLSLQLSRHSQ